MVARLLYPIVIHAGDFAFVRPTEGVSPPMVQGSEMLPTFVGATPGSPACSNLLSFTQANSQFDSPTCKGPLKAYPPPTLIPHLKPNNITGEPEFASFFYRRK